MNVEEEERVENKAKYVFKIDTPNLLVRQRSKTEHKNYEDTPKDQEGEPKQRAKEEPYDLSLATNSKKRKHIKTYSEVMNICKEHFIENIEKENKDWQARSLYSDLIARNKANLAQQLSFIELAQNMQEVVAHHDPATFYQYV